MASRALPPIHGHCHPDWLPVRQAFERNLRQERGAACAVEAEGELVVHLWAGEAAPGRPWQADTLCTAFSATKGIVATAFLTLVDRGRVELDAPVARYWPDFAQAGKQDITVRQLLEHRSGLVWLDEPLELEVLADLPALAEVLAAQAPGLPPGVQGYGATAWGAYVGVLYWKITGETAGTWLRREVRDGLGLDLHLGLDPTQGARLASLVPPGVPDLLFRVGPRLVADPGHDGRIYRAAVRPRSPTARAVANPPRLGRGHIRRLAEPEVLAIELPWVGAAVSAEALARFYGLLARGGGALVSREATRLPYGPAELVRDRVLHKRLTWRLGYLKEEPGVFSPTGEGYGHPGAGGTIGWAEPGHGVGIGYVMNRLDPRLRSPRTLRITHAVWEVLGG